MVRPGGREGGREAGRDEDGGSADPLGGWCLGVSLRQARATGAELACLLRCCSLAGLVLAAISAGSYETLLDDLILGGASLVAHSVPVCWNQQRTQTDTDTVETDWALLYRSSTERHSDRNDAPHSAPPLPPPSASPLPSLQLPLRLHRDPGFHQRAARHLPPLLPCSSGAPSPHPFPSLHRRPSSSPPP